jgi:hypothetical protein
VVLAHANFLPVPKSALTIFHLQQQVNNAREADGGENTSLPSFSADIITINATQRWNLEPAEPAATESGGTRRSGEQVNERTDPLATDS